MTSNYIVHRYKLQVLLVYRAICIYNIYYISNVINSKQLVGLIRPP